MINIAHLSDIHFGKRFDLATWKAVADAVVDFYPDLIIVSGDLVDHPSPAQLLAAKCALNELSERARLGQAARSAELFVIPGNHDVVEYGVAAGLSRLDWFERIFNGYDTAEAEAKLTQNLGCSPGFSETYQNRSAIKEGRLGSSSWLDIIFGTPVAKDFSAHLGPATAQPRVRTAANSPVLLALLDSNPKTAGPYAATGEVENQELISLKNELDRVKEPYLARVAVVHHHVLPIAFVADETKMTGEPLMVLRNAGVVLRILADNNFDLVLHGHWHKAQFARIDMGTADGESYPIAVAAAGSAAMRSSTPDENCINLISISDIGRITVKQVFYGGAQAPNPDAESERFKRTYQEPVAAVKHRAYSRARERHPIECDERVQRYEITENGDLLVSHTVKGLKLQRGPSPYRHRPLSVRIPPEGRFVPDYPSPNTLSECTSARLVAATIPNPAADTKCYWIELPGGGLQRGGQAVDYSLNYACVNCMIMTHWEAYEKLQKAKKIPPPADWDGEWVGLRVTYPMRKLILSVTFPESLAISQVTVQCSRHSKYPGYSINELGDAVLPPHPSTDAVMQIDPDLQGEEEQRLRYDAPTRTWCLDIDRPVVGCTYDLRWKLPRYPFKSGIAGTTREWQRGLLRLAGRIAGATALSDTDKKVIEEFNSLLETLEVDIRDKNMPDERRTTALFVYDADELALRPVLSHRSWTGELLGLDFAIPLGSGIAGAAFVQRRIVPWRKQWAGNSLIEPVPEPHASAEAANEAVNIVAIPVYHPDLKDARRPPPWAVIGVVSVSSSSYGSPIATLEDTDDKADDLRRHLRAAAQTQVTSILASLRGP
jgi:3',5'-cyclic AMP phosphodiesterase CpdA